MKTMMISVDHGLALAYFLQTELSEVLLDKGARLVFLVQDELLPLLRERYRETQRVVFESLREREAARYQNTHHSRWQSVIEYLRTTSADPRVPITYVDTHRQRSEYEARGKRRYLLMALRPVIGLLRHSKTARCCLKRAQNMFTPQIYQDLFDRYKPDLLVANTAGWRLDRYLLREATKRGIKTAVVIVGWDNPSSQGLPGADVEYANVWSEIHKWELVEGVDWPESRVHVGGMPLYDGYVNGKWVLPREDYFRMHGLDPKRKLIAFAATALSISPNFHIVKILAEMVERQSLSQPVQLLLRLHPNHFRNFPHYQQEKEDIYRLIRGMKHVHIVEPKPLAGNLPRYSGEDLPEKASMLAHCDVLVTIYSTMVVEAALHDKPVISVCIDAPKGWPGKYWIPLSEVPNWPTAARVTKADVGEVVFSEDELRIALDHCLLNPKEKATKRRKFVEDELTFLNGEATENTANFLWALANGDKF